MRLGEALALPWKDIDFGSRAVRAARTLSGRQIETPKSGHGRTVDMSAQVAKALLELDVVGKTETLKYGWTGMPAWVFCTDVGTPLDESGVRKAFRRVLEVTASRRTSRRIACVTPSLLLQHGESPAYVQRQLGHASIQLTVDTYGK